MTRVGAFELIEEIGQGAASRVWSAVHLPSQQKIALKIFNEFSGKRATDNLFREIRLVARASHPHIVRVFGYGQTLEPITLPSGDNLSEDHLYLVMELAEKGTLKGALGRVSWEETRAILLDILDGLARVHARGIVHLDLKPVNVLLTDRGAVVSDFGIAVGQQAQQKTPKRSKTNGLGKLALVGTPHFMAPEQCVSAQALYGPWTDLYAVGCIAHSLITGRPPYRDKEVVDVLIAHRTGEIPRLEDRFRVPVGFDVWLQKLMAKRWQDRFLWAEDARVALSRLGSPSNLASGKPSIASWSEPTILSNEQLSDETMVDVVMMKAEVPTGVIPLIAEQPDVAKEWVEKVADINHARPLEGVGIELNQFETAIIVGRYEERRQLWRQFARSARRNRITMTILKGAPGTGKSALADWLCSATHEQGVAHYLQARHSRDANVQDGILGALRTFLSIRHDADIPRIVSERLGLPEDDLLCNAMINLMRRTERTSQASVDVLRRTERDHLLCRLLEHLSQLRALILHLDDAQWGFDSLRMANTLLELNPRARVHLLITVNADELVSGSMAAKELEHCEADKAAEMLNLGPMSSEDCAMLVESRATLPRDAVNDLVTVSKGNPLFVREFLLSRLADDVRREHTGTTSMKKLWKVRIEQWLPAAPNGAAFALQAAAVLGSRINRGEWRALLPDEKEEELELIFSSALEVGFLDHELDGDFAFVHGLLRDSLLELSKDEGTFHALHRAAGEMLVAAQSRDFVRIASHLQNGNVLDVSSVYWEKAVEDFMSRDDYPLMRWALSQYTGLQRQRRLSSQDPQWWRVIWYWAFTDRYHYRVKKSLRRITRLEALVTKHAPSSSFLVEVLNAKATCTQRLEGPGTAVDILEEAASLAQRVAPEMYVDILVATAKDRKFTGKFMEAEVLYRQALETLGDDESKLRLRVSSHIRLGDCLSKRKCHEQALEEVQKGLELARRTMSPNLVGESLNLYGEVLRASGDLDGAEKAYSEAVELLVSIGSGVQYIARANLALVLQLRGAFKQSRRVIEDLLKTRSRLAYPRERMVFIAVLLPCLVDAGDMRGVDETLTRLEETFDVEWAEFDIAEAATRSADMLERSGETERTIRALRLAADQFRKLELQDDLAHTQTRIAELSSEN